MKRPPTRASKRLRRVHLLRHGARLRDAFGLVGRLPDLPPAELLGLADRDDMLAAGRPAAA